MSQPKYQHAHQTAEYTRHVDSLVESLAFLVSDAAAFEAKVLSGLKSIADPDAEKRMIFLKQGWLSYPLFLALFGKVSENKPQVVRSIWNALLEHDLIVENGIWFDNAVATHSIMPPRVRWHLECDTLRNLFYPVSATVERYRHAVLAIDVTKDGRKYRGTGFIVRHKKSDYIVTCKHNIFDKSGLKIDSITSVEGKSLQFSKFTSDDVLDLAACPISTSDIPTIRLFDSDPDIFETTYSVGFPKISGTLPALACHKGEINAKVHIYLDNSPAILISNIVAPGNSGGPVLMRSGHCVGMICKSLESEYDDGSSTFSAALPCRSIAEFLNRTFGSST